MSHLPVELAADILSRLPVKPLLQLRCVSKQWCALIDSPDFVKLHLNRSIETNSNRSIIFRDDVDLYSIDCDSIDRAVKLDHPFKPPEASGTGVMGSCNGLLCLSRATADIVFWNFSTRKHHKLPVDPIEYPRRIGIHIWGFIGHGFGYDSARGDYKLVRIVQGYDNKKNLVYSQVRVYSLQSNSWRRIQDFPYYLPSGPNWSQHNAVFVRGVLNWRVCREPRSTKADLIAAFDLGVEEYRLVPQPDYLDDDKDFHMDVGSLGGWLCINCNYYVRDRLNVWVMKEYGVKESWTKLFSVEKLGVGRALAFSRTGEEVLLHQCHAKLLWFDLKTKTKTKTVMNDVIPLRSRGGKICAGSLVPLRSSGE